MASSACEGVAQFTAYDMMPSRLRFRFSSSRVMRSVAVQSCCPSRGSMRLQAKSSRTQAPPVCMTASAGRSKLLQSGQRIAPAIPKGDL